MRTTYQPMSSPVRVAKPDRTGAVRPPLLLSLSRGINLLKPPDLAILVDHSMADEVHADIWSFDVSALARLLRQLPLVRGGMDRRGLLHGPGGRELCAGWSGD